MDNLILLNRRGSLIVDHDIVTKDNEEGSQKLAVAVYDLKSNSAPLTFDGKPVNVSSIRVDNKEGKQMVLID